MVLDPEEIAHLTLSFAPQNYLRVFPARHQATPLAVAAGHSRFSSSDGSFLLLYAAQDLPTALAEAVVRDRFEGAVQRILDQSELEYWSVAAISAAAPLNLVDIRTTGALRLGISTDMVGAKAHQAGQNFSAELHQHFGVDGLLYPSRLTRGACMAVYDRAIVKLTIDAVANLVCLADLIPALESLNVQVRAA